MSAGKILILNGPNLNMLGRREPEIYGTQTLDDLRTLCEKTGNDFGFSIDFRQSNHEGELVTWVQDALDKFDALIINAGGYTHTSIALHDALKILKIPVIEVHLSDPQKREAFRHHSFVEPLATAVFKGHGVQGYIMALEKLRDILKS